MTQQLIRQVLRDGSKDTRNYRYVARMLNGADKQYQVIKRIAIDALDTTAALTDKSDTNPHGWEIVYTEA
jgi:hypothetical protein